MIHLNQVSKFYGSTKGNSLFNGIELMPGNAYNPKLGF